MTLKDIHGIYSLVDRHRKPALLPVRRVWQGCRAHTAFRHLLHCGFPAHSSLVVLQEWGVLCLAEAVVAATVWMWFLLLMGKKGVVGQPFLPWCCGDSQSMAVGLSVASRLVWCSCFCRVQGGEAVRQHCSCSRLGLGDLSQHLPGSLAVGAWESSLPPAWDAGTCAWAAFHPVLPSRSWCFRQRFLSPHWGLRCLDALSYIFFMASHLQGRAMPCSFWPTCALDI